MVQELKVRLCSAALWASVGLSADNWTYEAGIPIVIAIVRAIARAARQGWAIHKRLLSGAPFFHHAS
jgi:hypothetical protein